jgi:hypothetical protein
MDLRGRESGPRTRSLGLPQHPDEHRSDDLRGRARAGAAARRPAKAGLDAQFVSTSKPPSMPLDWWYLQKKTWVPESGKTTVTVIEPSAGTSMSMF